MYERAECYPYAGFFGKSYLENKNLSGPYQPVVLGVVLDITEEGGLSFPNVLR